MGAWWPLGERAGGAERALELAFLRTSLSRGKGLAVRTCWWEFSLSLELAVMSCKLIQPLCLVRLSVKWVVGSVLAPGVVPRTQ